MEDFAKKYLDWYQGQSKIVRALLCLLWDIPSNLYRFSKSALKKDNLGICLSIICAIFGGFILFVIDLICICAMDKLFWLDDFSGDAPADNNDDSAKAEEPVAEPEVELEAEVEAEEAPAEEPKAEN